MNKQAESFTCSLRAGSQPHHCPLALEREGCWEELTFTLLMHAHKRHFPARYNSALFCYFPFPLSVLPFHLFPPIQTGPACFPVPPVGRALKTPTITGKLMGFFVDISVDIYQYFCVVWTINASPRGTSIHSVRLQEWCSSALRMIVRIKKVSAVEKQ